MERKLFRTQTAVSISSSDTVLAGNNPRRYAIVVDSPAANVSPQLQESQLVHNVSTASTGVKLSYTVPAGVQAYLQSASFFTTAGGPPTLALQVVRGANTITLEQGTANFVQNLSFALLAGDTVQWNCTVLQAASTADLSLSIVQDQLAGHVTVSFVQPAVLGNGINLYPGDPPLVLLYDHVGDAIREEIHAIAASGTPTITIVDIFESNCPCQDPALTKYSDPYPIDRLSGGYRNG